MKKNYIIPLLLISLLTSCTTYKVPSTCDFELTPIENKISLYTDLQKEFFDSENPDEFIQNHLGQLQTNVSSPRGINFKWNDINDTNVNADKYVVYISEDENFSSAWKKETTNKEIEIKNFKLDETYYWKVEGHYHDEVFTSDVSSFTTDKGFARNLYVEGVKNIRDIGGYQIGENKYIKQGLIYRSAEFNGATFNSIPSEYGKYVLTNELNIKTEIDLRKTLSSFNSDEVDGITSSPLGRNVKYVSAPMEFANKNIYTNENNKESVKLVFETLADIKNYPLVFHCVRGTDRTGAIAYVVGAICGMNKTDLMKDYLFSDFSDINAKVREININKTGFYVQGIEEEEGSTLKEKAINYLKNNVGISDKTINSIIDILID